MTIDSHCHLSQEDYQLPISEIISLAEKEGVNHILAVACDTKDWIELVNLLHQHPSLYGAVGIHPEYAHLDYSKPLSQLTNLFSKQPNLLAVGEIGLDYHESPETKEEQKKLFYEQIVLAHHIQKPIMIHTRDAEDDTMQILNMAHQKGLLENKGVFHCFTGSMELAQFAIQLGFYISASGIITFKSAATLRDIFSTIPPDKLLVETDAPWLAPEPMRGHINQPAYIQNTLKKLAEIKGVSVDEMEKMTDENFYRLYFKEQK